MSIKQENTSAISASLRAFFAAFFTTIGLLLGLFFFLFICSSTLQTTPVSFSTKYSPEIIPNANGDCTNLKKDSPLILKIDIQGVIGDENLTAESIRTMLSEAQRGEFKQERIKGVLLYIDSPGGTVTDANGIYRAIKRFKQTYNIPVFAYVDGLCASGGMYVASSADKIYATNVSLIGSVGVRLATALNVSKILNKLEIETLTLTAGKNKDALNPLRPWQAGEEQPYRLILEHYYQDFVNIVAKARPQIDEKKLIEHYGADVYPAQLALEYGFIDERVEDISEVIDVLAKTCNIEKDYQVLQLKTSNWINEVFCDTPFLLTGKIAHTFPQLSDPLLFHQ